MCVSSADELLACPDPQVDQINQCSVCVQESCSEFAMTVISPTGEPGPECTAAPGQAGSSERGDDSQQPASLSASPAWQLCLELTSESRGVHASSLRVCQNKQNKKKALWEHLQRALGAFDLFYMMFKSTVVELWSEVSFCTNQSCQIVKNHVEK